MQQAYNKRLMDYPREAGPSVNEVKTLGLIKDQKPEEVHMKPTRFIPITKPTIS